MTIQTHLDWDEAMNYKPGTIVEIKSKLGVRDIVDYYDPQMVPPIWLENDPLPRYPHELKKISGLNKQLSTALKYPEFVRV